MIGEEAGDFRIGARVQSPVSVTTPAFRNAAWTASVSIATFSLTLQVRHQSAVKSTKTGVPAARSSASFSRLNGSCRTSRVAAAAVGSLAGRPVVSTTPSARASGTSAERGAHRDSDDDADRNSVNAGLPAEDPGERERSRQHREGENAAQRLHPR